MGEKRGGEKKKKRKRKKFTQRQPWQPTDRYACKAGVKGSVETKGKDRDLRQQ